MHKHFQVTGQTLRKWLLSGPVGVVPSPALVCSTVPVHSRFADLLILVLDVTSGAQYIDYLGLSGSRVVSQWPTLMVFDGGARVRQNSPGRLAGLLTRPGAAGSTSCTSHLLRTWLRCHVGFAQRGHRDVNVEYLMELSPSWP